MIDELVAPDDVYDAAANWARRFPRRPARRVGRAKAGINAVFD
jgi:enoyl-CoA hydratase